MTPISEAILRANRIIGEKTGIISKVEFGDLWPGEPKIYLARATPADTSAFSNETALNYGDGASINKDRAIMKAVGESVERYCSAQFNKDEFLISSLDKLNEPAVDPTNFALFSARQYQTPNFRFQPLTTQTQIRWTSGYSLTNNRQALVPAGFVYVPYRFEDSLEHPYHFSISTGLACGTSRAMALYKGLMEAIERDAFTIVWRNRLTPSLIDLTNVEDLEVNKLIDSLKETSIEFFAFHISIDIQVPVVLVLLINPFKKPPYQVVGISADLSPVKALRSALEEGILTFLGMNRYANTNKNYKPEPNFEDLKIPIEHAMAYAVWPDLQKEIDFLLNSNKTISIQDITDRSQEGFVENIHTTTKLLNEKGLEAIALDLTTPDIDEAGFKVVRAVVPGLHPLDVNHNYLYLGGKRLYQAPYDAGLLERPHKEEELNMAPHCFP